MKRVRLWIGLPWPSEREREHQRLLRVWEFEKEIRTKFFHVCRSFAIYFIHFSIIMLFHLHLSFTVNTKILKFLSPLSQLNTRALYQMNKHLRRTLYPTLHTVFRLYLFTDKWDRYSFTSTNSCFFVSFLSAFKWVPVWLEIHKKKSHFSQFKVSWCSAKGFSRFRDMKVLSRGYCLSVFSCF